eukprot:gene2024-2301_t
MAVSETPKKINESLSPTVSHTFCVVCSKNIDTAYKEPKDNKIQLWLKDGVKAPLCINIEKFLNVDLSETDFKVICKACNRSIQTGLKNQAEKRNTLLQGRQLANLRYIRRHIKRQIPTDAYSNPGNESKRPQYECKRVGARRKIVEEDNEFPFARTECSQSSTADTKIKIILTTSTGCVTKRDVPDNLHSLTRGISDGNIKAIAHCAWKNENIREEIINNVGRDIAKECNSLCSKKTSNFRVAKDDVLKKLEEFTFTKQEEELENEAPLLWKFVLAAGCNKRGMLRNKFKKCEFIKPALLSSVAMILRTRNRQVNVNATLNALALRRGGADKMTNKRFDRLAICLSYGESLKYQEQLGTDTVHIIKGWRNGSNEALAIDSRHEDVNDNLQNAEAVATEILEISEINWSDDDESLTDALSQSVEDNIANDSIPGDGQDTGILDISATLQEVSISNDMENHSEKSLHDKETKKKDRHFILAGDNVNLSLKAKHTSREKGNKQLNLFNCIASEARVPFVSGTFKNRLPIDERPENVPLSIFLPNDDDDLQLKLDFKFIIAKTLIKHFEEVGWFAKYTLDNMHHQFMQHTSKKSNTLCLGVLDKDENVGEDIIQIMHFLHKFVPEEAGEIHPVLSFGDELTCEREQNAQEDQRDGPLPVIWSILYDSKSAADQGTLYSAKNFLNAKNVPSNPMHDIDATYDLIQQYTEALIVTAYGVIKEKHNLSVNKLAEEQKVTMEIILNSILEEYVMPSIAVDWKDTKDWQCKECGKTYKNISTLRKHKKDKHEPGATVSSYKCKDCGKVYVKEAGAKRHAKTHYVGTNLEHDEEFIALVVKKSAVVKEMPHEVPPEDCVAENDGKDFRILSTKPENVEMERD